MKSALVTGHKGFVGCHLVPKLEDRGYEVTGTEDFAEYCSSPLSAIKVYDVVVHLAANIVNVDDRMKAGMIAYEDIILDYAFCSWIEKHPPKEAAILMSSCAVDFPDDPYCIVKRTLERYGHTLHARGLPVVMLRPFSGYSHTQSLEYPFPAILDRARQRQDPLTVWGGSQVRDWLHIHDLTDAILHAITSFPRGVPIEIGTGTGTDFISLARKIARGFGYCPQVVGDQSKAVSSKIRIANPATAAEYGWRALIPLEKGIAIACAAVSR